MQALHGCSPCQCQIVFLQFLASTKPQRRRCRELLNEVGMCFFFAQKYFVLFPKLENDSEKRMKDTWYLSKMKSCGVKAA